MDEATSGISGYRYENTAHSQAHSYLLPAVLRIVRGIDWPTGDFRIFELGSGNGATADFLVREGFSLTGVDPSEEGIAHARMAYPHIRIEPGSCYDDLADRYGRFPVVLSLEVVEPYFFRESLRAGYLSFLRTMALQSFRHLFTDTGKISPSRYRANWTSTSRHFGITDILSFGPKGHFENSFKRLVSRIFVLNALGGSGRSQSR